MAALEGQAAVGVAGERGLPRLAHGADHEELVLEHQHRGRRDRRQHLEVRLEVALRELALGDPSQPQRELLVLPAGQQPLEGAARAGQQLAQPAEPLVVEPARARRRGEEEAADRTIGRDREDARVADPDPLEDLRLGRGLERLRERSEREEPGRELLLADRRDLLERLGQRIFELEARAPAVRQQRPEPRQKLVGVAAPTSFVRHG